MGDNAANAATEKKSRNSYTLEKKSKCIATAGRLKNVDNAAQLEDIRGKNNNKLTKGRPIKLKEFDTGLAEWIWERRVQKKKITYKLITHEAALRPKNTASGTNLLKLSNGWRDKFLRLHRFTLRKPTSVAQKAPSDYAQKMVKFVTST